MDEQVDVTPISPEVVNEEGKIKSPKEILEERNKALIDEVHALGGNVPPVMLIHLQLDVMIELLFPKGGVLREVFEYEVEGRLSGILEEIKREVLRQKLSINR